MIPLQAIWHRNFPFFLREAFRKLRTMHRSRSHGAWRRCAIRWSSHTQATSAASSSMSRQSITTAVAFCAWLLRQDPTPKILMTTYNADLARQHDQQPRQIMESREYRAGRTPWGTRSSGTGRRWERISASHDFSSAASQIGVLISVGCGCRFHAVKQGNPVEHALVICSRCRLRRIAIVGRTQQG